MKKNKNLIDTIFLTILSVQTVGMGVAFAVQVLRIYFSADKGAFSREICATHLLQILPVMIIWVLMVIANAIYFTINKRKDSKKPKMTYSARLNLMSGLMKDFNSENPISEYEDFKKEERNRLLARIINLVVLVICSIMGILFLANPDHFVLTEEINPTNRVINMTYYLMPWVIIALISELVSMFYIEYSSKKSIDILKAIMKHDGRGKRSFYVNKKVEIAKTVATYSLLVAAVVLIIVGVVDGSAQNVLLKACAICTECIGLG